MGCQQSKVAAGGQQVGGGEGGGGGGGRNSSNNGGVEKGMVAEVAEVVEGRNGQRMMIPRCSLTTEPEHLLKLDPRSPLETRQIYKLKQSWKGIRRHMDDTGIEMFVRLFKSNGDLKNMFHAFKDLSSDDDMRSNESLENHATLVMTTLDDAITHIDNFDYVSEVLRKTGASHVRFEGFTSDNFWNIREPFLEAVKITLGDRYTDNMEGIYKVAISFILQTMSDGMDEAIKAKAQDNS
ncbi:neuroglobin-like isoform X2 [Babylonia areolata]|uniref:neuroglobin-like isoform X2 n=1 Tax=Babylonia areolata TaxID=304850 RepID=UPI003FD43BF6